MNKASLKIQLTSFFEKIPVSFQNLDINYIENFSNLFFRFIAEIPGEGLVYPGFDRIKVAALNEPIKDIFEENMRGIATSIQTPQEYSTKVGSSLDAVILLLPQTFILAPGDVPEIAPFSLSTDLIQITGPVLSNPASTSYDLANAIVEGFVIKLNASAINNANAGTRINWITN
jgi:hypothetical protein